MSMVEPGMEEKGGGAFSLERAFNAVRRRLSLVAAIAGAVTIAGTSFAMLMPNRYEGMAVVQIDPRKKTISQVDSVVEDLKGDNASIDSEVEVISSRAVALKVIDILNLRDDEEFRPPSRVRQLMHAVGLGRLLPESATASRSSVNANPARLDQDPNGTRVGRVQPGESMPERDEMAVQFLERLKVTRVRTTLLLEIKFTAGDPVKAARIANTIAEVYIAGNLSNKKQASGFATQLLEGKLAEMQQRVADAERKVAMFKSDNNIFDSEGNVLSEKEMARLMEQTVSARSATAEAKAKYENAQRLVKMPGGTSTISEVIQSNSVGVLKEAVAAARKREAELATRYGPRHPEMQKVRAEIAQAEAQLAEEVEREVANLKNVYVVAERREMQLRQSLTTLKEQEAATKEASVRLLELQREAATSKQLYESLLVRYKQTSETQDLQLPDARIVEQADTPLVPSSPKRLQLALLALIAGLGIGIGAALVLEFATPGLSHPDDVERTLEVAHIASVPAAVAGSDPLRSIRLVLADPRGVFAESVRGIRREIDMRHRTTGSRVVMVASSLPGEGTDVIASNLAHHYAITGQRVLLVDGDLRRSPLTRKFAPQRASGLLDTLARGQPVETAILHDRVSGLYFLPAMGPSPMETGRPELLGSRRMSGTIEVLKSQFDVIVIDTPPLLPVVDARVLADYADQIVFVTTWRRTPKQLARRALQCLGINHDKVAGVVMNSVAEDAMEESFALGTGMGSAAPRRFARAA
ncbi:MAG: polysaccharide biosynthesis tyrosine autokinase [Deltaproteobacteria bacterium]